MYRGKSLEHIENRVSDGELYLKVGDLKTARNIFREALYDMPNVREMSRSPEYRETLRKVKTSLIRVNNLILIERVNLSVPKEEYRFELSDLEMILEQKDNVFVKAYDHEIDVLRMDIRVIREMKESNERNKGAPHSVSEVKVKTRYVM